MNCDSIDDLLKQAGRGCLPLDDPFFSETYETFNVFGKVGITVEDDEDLCHRTLPHITSASEQHSFILSCIKILCDVQEWTFDSIEEFQCDAPNCVTIFRNLADYEIHYNGLHRYTCEECQTTRPNARLLEIHTQETHDSFFRVSSRKRPMYQCYVTECEEKFSDPQERRIHCATVHRFPENFRYESGVTEPDENLSKTKKETEADDSVEPWFANGRDPELSMETSMGLPECSLETNTSMQNPNIPDSGGSTDLLNGLPALRVGYKT